MHKGYFAKHLALSPSHLDKFSHFDNKNKKIIFVDKLITLDNNKRIPAPNTLASKSLRAVMHASPSLALGSVLGRYECARTRKPLRPATRCT